MRGEQRARGERGGSAENERGTEGRGREGDQRRMRGEQRGISGENGGREERRKVDKGEEVVG